MELLYPSARGVLCLPFEKTGLLELESFASWGFSVQAVGLTPPRFLLIKARSVREGIVWLLVCMFATTANLVGRFS